MKKLLLLTKAILLASLFSLAFNANAQIITNADFESWTSGAPDGWVLTPDGTDITFSQGTGLGKTGDALIITAITNGGGLDGTLSNTVTGIVAGHLYSTSIFTKSNDDEILIRFWNTQWLDINDAVIDDIDNNDYSPITGDVWSEYTTPEAIVEAPANAVKLKVNFRIYIQPDFVTNTSNIILDDLTVVDNGAAPLTFPLSESFENAVPPTDWTVTKTGDTEEWEISDCSAYGPGSAVEGSMAAMYNIYNAEDGSTTTMTTHTIDMSNAIKPVLDFKYWMRGSSYGSNPNLTINISNDNGDTWTEIFNEEAFENPAEWYNDIIFLEGTNNQTKLQFVGTSDFGYYNLFLDDIQLREASTENDIVAFSFDEQLTPAVINTSQHTINIETVYGTVLNGLVATFELSDLASAKVVTTTQVSGTTANDFSSNVEYSVMAEDSSTQTWTVTATVAANPSAENNILTFTIPEQTSDAVINNTNHTVDLTIGWQADMTDLTPTIETSLSSTINPASDFSQDFSDTVTYTVTAQNGDEQIWNVIATQDAPPEGATCGTAFAYTNINDVPVNDSLIAGEENWFSFYLDTKYKDVVVSLCGSNFDTQLSIYEDCNSSSIGYNDDGDNCTGRSSEILKSSLDSGMYYAKVYGYETYDEGNYILEITGTETSSENDITAFSFAEQTGSAIIDAGTHTVAIEVAMGTVTTSLVPTIEVSDYATIDPVTGVAQDFSVGFPYTVTAENGTEQVWTINTTVATSKSRENNILAFSFPEQTGAAIIDTAANTVSVEIAWNPGSTILTPTFTISDLASVDIASGVERDFANPVAYVVTSEDTTSSIWTVTVSVETAPEGATCGTAEDYGNVNDPAQTGQIVNAYDYYWYQVTLTEDMANVTFSLCNSDFDTKLELWEDCDDANFIEYNDDDCGNRSTITVNNLTAGTYYAKIYAYNANTGNYELEITGESINATLSDLTVDATTVTGFEATTLTYNVELAYGTTDIPTVASVLADINATKIETQAVNLDGTLTERTATVVVTAEDGVTSLTYSVIFTVETAVGDDAKLSDLTVDATTVTGFDADTLTYNVELAYGTIVIPTVAGVVNHQYATKVETQATDLAGDLAARTATVEVLAEDASTTLTYSVVFTIAAAPSTDATLSDLTVDATTVTGFEATTLTYNVELAYGTTDIPTVAGVLADTNATKVETQATDLAGDLAARTATVEVLAEDASTTLTYSVVFTIAAAPSTDATLSDLTVDATTVTGFEATTLTYNVELAYGTTDIPTVAGVLADTNATKTETQATDLAGDLAARTATIEVLAEDASTTLTYSVVFTVLTDVNNIDATLDLNIYPNPNKGEFTLNINSANTGDVDVSIINLQGQTVYAQHFDNVTYLNKNIDIQECAKGIYYVNIKSIEGTRIQKIVIQ